MYNVPTTYQYVYIIRINIKINTYANEYIHFSFLRYRFIFLIFSEHKLRTLNSRFVSVLSGSLQENLMRNISNIILTCLHVQIYYKNMYLYSAIHRHIKKHDAYKMLQSLQLTLKLIW